MTLTEGYWLNEAYLASSGHRTDPDRRWIRTALLAGRYSWEACRWWNTEFRQYRVRATLSRGGLKYPVLNELNTNHIYGTGTYEWGGRLAWDGPLGSTQPASR